jgi:hypothetical protein
MQRKEELSMELGKPARETWNTRGVFVLAGGIGPADTHLDDEEGTEAGTAAR